MESAACLPALDLEATLCLLRAAQAGDLEARNELFRQHAPLAVETARMAMGWNDKRLQDSEDAAQDGLIAALEGIETFKPEWELNSPGTFRYWLARCVKNAMIDGYRRKQAKKRGGDAVILRLADLKRVDGSTVLLAGDDPTPSKLAWANERKTLLQAALGKLLSEEREVVLWHHLSGMSFPEISRVHSGKSAKMWRSVYHRAIGKLRANLDSES